MTSQTEYQENAKAIEEIRAKLAALGTGLKQVSRDLGKLSGKVKRSKYYTRSGK